MALRKEDFDQLFEKARLHAEAGRSASKPRPFEIILISIGPLKNPQMQGAPTNPAIGSLEEWVDRVRGIQKLGFSHEGRPTAGPERM